jgi:hypothetical protein
MEESIVQKLRLVAVGNNRKGKILVGLYDQVKEIRNKLNPNELIKLEKKTSEKMNR